MLHLVELWVDGLTGLLEHVDELLGLLGIGGGKEGVRCASVLCTSSSTDTMDVVLSVGGKVKIYDILYVSDIFLFGWLGRKGGKK